MVLRKGARWKALPRETTRRWRRREALLRTLRLRPDLLGKGELAAAERRLLRAMGWEG